MKYRTLSAIATLICELTFFYNVFLFFYFVNTRVYADIGYWPWACGGATILILNRWFLGKKRTLASIIALNTLLVSAWVFLGFRYFFIFQGMTARVFAVGLLISTAVRAIYLSIHEVPDQRMIFYTELCIIGTGLFFFIHMEPFMPPFAYNIPSFAAVFLNMLALINVRLFSENVKGIGLAKLRGGVFLATITGIIIAGVVSILGFMTGPFRTLAINVYIVVKDFITKVYMLIAGQINLFFLWLRHGQEYEDAPMEYNVKVPKIKMRGTSNIHLYENMSRFLPWIMALLAVSLLIYLFIKLRRKEYKIKAAQSTGIPKRIKKEFSLWGKLKEFVKALYRKARLFFLFIYLRHTPQGVFLIIERWGKRKGFPRKVSETPGTYLGRLMRSKAWEKELKETEVTELVNRLIKELDRKFYSRNTNSGHQSFISKGELKMLGHIFMPACCRVKILE